MSASNYTSTPSDTPSNTISNTPSDTPSNTISNTPTSTTSQKRKKIPRPKSSWVWDHFKTSDINAETEIIL
jgi:hypothetical protein